MTSLRCHHLPHARHILVAVLFCAVLAILFHQEFYNPDTVSHMWADIESSLAIHQSTVEYYKNATKAAFEMFAAANLSESVAKMPIKFPRLEEVQDFLKEQSIVAGGNNKKETPRPPLPSVKKREGRGRKQPKRFPVYIALDDEGGVVLTDVIWVPSESKIALIALASRFFRTQTEEFEYIGRGINKTFASADLKPPEALLPHLTWNQDPIDNCTDIPTLTGDAHIDFNMYILHCEVNSASPKAELAHGRTSIAVFDADAGLLNAAAMMGFAARGGVTNNRQKRGLSMKIAGVENFTPLFVDLVRYYQRQGVQHIYFAVTKPFEDETTRSYYKALSDAGIGSDFVSIGWWESTDLDIEGMAPKMIYANSALYHARNYDEMLLVVDLDEVPVSNDPTATTFVEVIFNQTSMNDTCFTVLEPYLVISPANASADTLGEKYPHRCNETGFYQKSALVLENCDHAGVHIHGACHAGTERKDLSIEKASLHHYVNLWMDRYGREKCPDDTPSELAIFERHGIIGDTEPVGAADDV
jgi:hypothetical protein